MIDKKQVFFVPGFTGVDKGDWPYWLEGEFVKAGFEFKLLSMPNIMCPEVSEWVGYLKDQKIRVNKNTYFIGHSLGCITIVRFLEQLPKKEIAGGCVFVAGFSSLINVPLLINFCTDPLDFSKVKNHAQEFVVVMSDNDHLIPQSSSEEFALKLGARTILESGLDHFAVGVKKLPSVLNSILEMDQMKEELKEIKRLKKL